MIKDNKLPAWFSKILLFIGGIAATHGFSYFFDYAIYPFVTYTLGFWKSLLVLFIAALLLNYILVLIYDLLKKDLFGFEAIKKMQGDEFQDKKRFLHKILKWGDIPVFIAFSFYDPIFAVLYKRKSTEFDGFKKRDYKILILSTAIGCLLWSGIWSGAFTVFNFIKSFF